MSQASTGIQAHLTRFIQDMMQQKFRLDTTKNEYEELLDTIRERIIDQTNLIQTIDEGSVKQFEDRKHADQQSQVNIEGILAQKTEILEKITLDVYHHMVELSNLELSSSGFITHIITTDEQTDYDENAKVITFKGEGRAEIPIATTLRRWTDASQLKII